MVVNFPFAVDRLTVSRHAENRRSIGHPRDQGPETPPGAVFAPGGAFNLKNRPEGMGGNRDCHTERAPPLFRPQECGKT